MEFPENIRKRKRSNRVDKKNKRTPKWQEWQKTCLVLTKMGSPFVRRILYILNTWGSRFPPAVQNARTTSIRTPRHSQSMFFEFLTVTRRHQTQETFIFGFHRESIEGICALTATATPRTRDDIDWRIDYQPTATENPVCFATQRFLLRLILFPLDHVDKFIIERNSPRLIWVFFTDNSELSRSYNYVRCSNKIFVKKAQFLTGTVGSCHSPERIWATPFSKRTQVIGLEGSNDFGVPCRAGTALVYLHSREAVACTYSSSKFAAFWNRDRCHKSGIDIGRSKTDFSCVQKTLVFWRTALREHWDFQKLKSTARWCFS